MIQAHSDNQYGLLVAEDWFGNIIWDAWGYGPYE